MTGFEPWHHARIPMLFLQRPTTLVRTPPVGVLYPVRGLQHHGGDSRKPRAFQSNLTVGTHVRLSIQRNGRLKVSVPFGSTGTQLVVTATPPVAQPSHDDIGIIRIQGHVLSVQGRTHAHIRGGTPYLNTFYDNLLGHACKYIITRIIKQKEKGRFIPALKYRASPSKKMVNPTLDYPNKVADECEKWFRKLSEWGLLHGWHEGMYV